jgi:hypothetical protein
VVPNIPRRQGRLGARQDPGTTRLLPNARRGRPRGTSGRSSITPTRAARQKGKAAQRAAAYAAFPGRAYRRALTAHRRAQPA